MALKILKLMVFIAAILGAAIFISTISRRSSENGINLDLKVSTSTTINFPTLQKVATTSENIISENTVKIIKPKPKPISYVAPPVVIKEVSSKSFEELVNSAVIQLYCGYLGGEGTNYSGISRGSGIIISKKGEILTNRHIIYDENMKKARPDCFVLKSPFPNSKSEKPKIYYSADIVSYPLTEKISEVFSKDKYYNDFAILKIASRPETGSKINQLLQTDYASEADYAVLENDSVFNYFPIDWNYRPQNSDSLITLGYGVDAAHFANQITSTIGRLAGNIDVNKTGKPQILLIESNATSGFSGGALINPQSKGLIGLISWITSGDVAGKYTVTIFRDFLTEMMLNELDFNLKAL